MTLQLPKFIMKRGDTYAVRYSIPKRFQAVVGRKEIVRSLGTNCLSEAIALRNDAIGEIEQELTARLEMGDMRCVSSNG
ncbi:MAG TPA: hypothetical protein DEO85_00280 [Maritimibacter sp.]|nr:hypothetical protein [Maritimibacter sp.]